MKEFIKRWLEEQKQKNAENHAKRVEREADMRYNIVQHIQKDGSRETYLTLDGERISTNYGNDYAEAVFELFALRMDYQAEN